MRITAIILSACVALFVSDRVMCVDRGSDRKEKIQPSSSQNPKPNNNDKKTQPNVNNKRKDNIDTDVPQGKDKK